ncbi:PadR family transcriptional regulator [Anaerocolumna sp. AGMB13025]|uniref:PadR family transcriptional regulator n=1 Tax=Anaerocolumna sp. AGMB13025 TaxID=3039116 RepID=UPI00241F8936|nr:PadR family transcriptional regulator [Anaerocolumna sp. AGMB13025]WFR60051.1 PadR family transcriptional regulator [Anaerocolumna sp. AGMB13025]
MIKNKTRYAILGVLSVMPGSGYDIKKFCDQSISHFWNENFGHIYPVLAQLEKEGLIEQENKEADDRRKVYGITEQGRKEFYNWMIQPVEYQPVRSELLLKLFYGNFIETDKIIKLLTEVKERKQDELKEYKAIEDSYKNNEKAREQPYYPYFLAPLRHGISSAQATIRWCEETIMGIEEHMKNS